MLKLFSRIILKLTGWQLVTVMPEEKKFILIGAPHTSNWDFPLALLVFWTIDCKIHWVAKIQMFRGPLHYIFTALGGIPVDRSSSNGFIKQIAERFEAAENMILTIAPEGTRSKSKHWKSGFYHIALAADVPICLGYIDFAKRKLGWEKMLYPSGDIEADMKIIAEIYEDVKGKRPEQQGPVRLKKHDSD